MFVTSQLKGIVTFTLLTNVCWSDQGSNKIVFIVTYIHKPYLVTLTLLTNMCWSDQGSNKIVFIVRAYINLGLYDIPCNSYNSVIKQFLQCMQLNTSINVCYFRWPRMQKTMNQ